MPNTTLDMGCQFFQGHPMCVLQLYYCTYMPLLYPRVLSGGFFLLAANPNRAKSSYQRQSTMNALVSPSTLPLRLEANTSFLPSWENMGKPSKSGW